ncbi:MAG TPA: MBL fold metallo-hydrolase [Thiobacillaceae bacterium]|nr:MBL fold metallo-hydrolase [Thiobacillaceae bacterium]
MRFQVIPVTPFEQNCSLVWCEATGSAALVDPGGDVDLLLAEVEKAGVRLDKLLLTHAHIDHVAGTPALARRLGLPVYGPGKADAFWLDALPEQSRMFGFPACEAFRPDHWLQDGDTVELGELRFQVIHCPGHTPGHVVFYEPASRHAFVGDVLFQGSIGRTDFPRGDHRALIHAIREKLFPLGDEVAFVPGHGPMSTFGRERRSNPYVGDRA